MMIGPSAACVGLHAREPQPRGDGRRGDGGAPAGRARDQSFAGHAACARTTSSSCWGRRRRWPRPRSGCCRGESKRPARGGPSVLRERVRQNVMQTVYSCRGSMLDGPCRGAGGRLRQPCPQSCR
ncbi:MAG: hypothetical protein MZW92_11985 [Comamonadaceae bacterium]|nr:hypothetical protein [Comamonadaceae bacterium]